MENKTSQLPEYLKTARPFKEGEAFYIFNWEWLPVYSFMIMLGMIFAILTIAFFWKREKWNFDHLFTLIIITIPTSIIGARLGYIFEQLIAGNADKLKDNWWNIRSGGLSIQWGVILATISDLTYIYFKRTEIDYRKAMSFILPAVLIGQAVGRWGNYTNHEVYGKIDLDGSSVLWLGEIIVRNMFISDSVNQDGALRVPLFFYEFLTSLIGYLLLVWVFNLFNWFKPGVTGAMYLIWYGIVRASMEFLRQEAYLFYFILALIYIFLGVILAIYFQFFANFKYLIVNNKLKIEKVVRYQVSKEKFMKITWKKYQRVETVSTTVQNL
ncbi:prolipoprotein diacylglyceryl transferase [Mesomycoplasma molare]|uniref:Phosphatidylglycerol--prolipoprotein diacylglyceryl transferase n=1 Tax=Mesomycoplasma molare TaxID=171288 RepID=A0ABY5TTT4_9BACT|nr:prolipoprotein diacylglyceryl transferase [Mesomycoplasma molare]UWD34077.1 prolipoprotein diacylglyceryl transferase [Mesomycoplasma molare]